MKKLFFVVSLMMVLALAPMAMADTITTTGTGGDHDGFGPYQAGLGGEFAVIPSAGLAWVLGSYVNGVTKNLVAGSLNFQTFCVEEHESISGNSTYTAFLSNRAIEGSVGPAGDPLSKGSAWLYHEFQIKGNFDGYATYNYNDSPAGGRKISASALQATIWYLEDEAGDPGAGNVFRNAVIAEFGSFANAHADNNGLYPVAVLNLYNSDGSLAQDLLVCVPEPATMLLLGSGLLGLAGFARKRFKK